MLKLFYATGTCALASHIALEEAGAGTKQYGSTFVPTTSANRSIWRSIRRAASLLW